MNLSKVRAKNHLISNWLLENVRVRAVKQKNSNENAQCTINYTQARERTIECRRLRNSFYCVLVCEREISFCALIGQWRHNFNCQWADFRTRLTIKVQ